MPSDLTSVIARGDMISIGSCQNLRINTVEFHGFDALSGAGAIFSSKYSNSEAASFARAKGFTILGFSLEASITISNYCSQAEGDEVPVQIGTISAPQGESGNVLERLVAIKGFDIDLNDFVVIPEHNWRGTRSQLFAQKPYQTWPSQYILKL